MPSWLSRLAAHAIAPGDTDAQLELKRSATSPIIAMHFQGEPRWTPRDYTALAREGFAKNSIAYRCVRMISEAAASVPWLVYEGTREIDQHPLIDLLARPNPRNSGPELFEAWYGHLQVAGNSYLEAVSFAGAVRELYALRPDRMKLVAGEDGWASAYEYTASGNTIRFDQDQPGVPPILHMALFHPIDDHYGLSPIEVAATAIDIHNAASSWNKALLDNSARPSGALVYAGADGTANLTQDQFERVKRELEDTYQGAINAGRPMLLEGGLDWKAMSLSPRDMDFIEAKHVAAREIALAFGVPPMLLGIPGDNTFANYQEANRTFWRQTVLPLVAKTVQSLGAWLTPAYGTELRLWFDVDAIEALSTEREALWGRLAGADFLSSDEKRVAVGYAPRAQTSEAGNE